MDSDQDEGEESKFSSSNSDSDTDGSLSHPDNYEGEEPPTPPRHRFQHEAHKMMQTALEEEAELERAVKDWTKALADANELVVKKQDKIEELRERKSQLDQSQGQNLGEGPSVRTSLPLSSKAGDTKKFEKKEVGVAIAPELRFPEEIWEMIMKNLRNPKDLWSASNSCHLLQKVLSPKYLWIFDMVFPILFSHLDKQVILTFRLVCKRWNGVVDNFFENHPSLTAYSEETLDHRSPPFRTPMREKGIGLYKFSDSREYARSDLRNQDFLTKMRDHPRNPFIGRSLTISKWPATNFGMGVGETDSDIEAEEELDPDVIHCSRYWRRVTKFLEVFGEHIWYLTFASWDEYQSILGNVLTHEFLTRNVFFLCPNLRKLRIGGSLNQMIIEEVAVPFPPPPATKLHTLQLDNVSYDPNVIIPRTMFRNYFQQLKGLDVTGECWRTVSHLDWSNLTELYLNMIEDDEWGLAALLDLKVPNLRKLGLNLRAASNDELELLLGIIIQLSERAPHFNALRLYRGYPAEAVKRILPHLYAPPNLTTLEFQSAFSTAPNASFAFLVRFPAIQNLNIYWPTALEPGRPDVNYRLDADVQIFSSCHGVKDELRGELVQVRKYMYGKTMYESNIWSLLPRLKVFTFQSDLYTRHGYEEYSRKVIQFQCLKKGCVGSGNHAEVEVTSLCNCKSKFFIDNMRR